MPSKAALRNQLLLTLVSRLVGATSCPSERLAVYKLELETFWDERNFPKQYPQWRPNAQWSKTIGYSHGLSLSLFTVGHLVDEGVRQFVETGDSEVLDQGAENRTFLDAILAPPILKGVGKTSANIFVDGNNSRVSAMTKIVPSPDWFVGLDSLQLCKDGHFIQTYATEVFPLDAGTDNGFTFTSPNWETEPRAEVFTITNSFPAHPAGSFHYPALSRLPRLAVYSLTKLREYTMDEDFHDKNLVKKSSLYEYNVLDDHKGPAGSDQPSIEFVPIENAGTRKATREDKKLLSKGAEAAKTQTNTVHLKDINAVSNARKRVSKKKLKLGGGLLGSQGFRGSTATRGYHASTSPNTFLKKRYSSAFLNEAQSRIFPIQAGSKSALYSQILASYDTQKTSNNLLERHKKKRRLRSKKRKRKKKPRNCHVTGWGAWGACSKSCGIGESVRTRSVRQGARGGGTPCPALIDYRWCGSARNSCKAGYFKW